MNYTNCLILAAYALAAKSQFKTSTIPGQKYPAEIVTGETPDSIDNVFSAFLEEGV
jgi:hypothetical protein